MHRAAEDRGALSRMARFVIAKAPLMIGGWLLFVVAVNVLVPQLESVVAKDSTPFVPPSAPVSDPSGVEPSPDSKPPSGPDGLEPFDGPFCTVATEAPARLTISPGIGATPFGPL